MRIGCRASDARSAACACSARFTHRVRTPPHSHAGRARRISRCMCASLRGNTGGGFAPAAQSLQLCWRSMSERVCVARRRSNATAGCSRVVLAIGMRTDKKRRVSQKRLAQSKFARDTSIFSVFAFCFKYLLTPRWHECSVSPLRRAVQKRAHDAADQVALGQRIVRCLWPLRTAVGGVALAVVCQPGRSAQSLFARELPIPVQRLSTRRGWFVETLTLAAWLEAHGAEAWRAMPDGTDGPSLHREEDVP